MNWTYVRLNEVTENLDSKRIPLKEEDRKKKKSEKILYPYIGATKIIDYIDEYIFDEEILCISEDGGNWGKGEECAFIYKGKTWVNNHAHVLIAKDKIHLKFLMYYLNYSDLSTSITGTTRGKLTQSLLNALQIPLPSLEEQKRIAEILDKSIELIDKRKKILENLSLLEKVEFERRFGNLDFNDKNYPIATIRDLTESTNYGTSAKAHETLGNYPCLRMGNITYDGDWNFKDLKYIDLDEKDLEKYLVYKGDLLFNRTNSKELVGKTAVYQEDNPVAYAGYLIRLRTNEKALTEYISGYLNSLHGKSVLQNMCKNIVGMANINAQELKSIKILVPPISEQVKYKQFIERVRTQKKQSEESLKQLNLLYQSLLQRAFRGELTKEKVR